LIALLDEYSHEDFSIATEKLHKFIFTVKNLNEILEQIGIIPESITHDSTEEKLFAKVSDAVLARSFIELGLKSTVLTKRADSADVIAKSKIYGYTLVADAKAFRLSRTAKNQKDFKVNALSHWRKDADFAVLCSPYFQYPKRQSQIYAQSLDNNVCLLSWEHILFLLQNHVKENEHTNLSTVWNFSEQQAESTLVSHKKNCFIQDFDLHCSSLSKISTLKNAPFETFSQFLNNCVDKIKARGSAEKLYWLAEIRAIEEYSREQAIAELLKSKKIAEKIRQIEFYVNGISYD